MSLAHRALRACLLGTSLLVVTGCPRDEPGERLLDAIDASAHAHDVQNEPPDVTDASAHAHDVQNEPPDVTDASVHAHDAPVDGVLDGATRDRARDLEFRLDAWRAYLGHRAEFRLVDRDDSLVSLVVLRAVSTGRERFALAAAMDERPARLDWFVDADDDPSYGPSDASSSVPTPRVPPFELSLSPEGAASTPTTLPADRADLVGHLSGFAVHAGVRFELSVTPAGSERTVALYRDESMSGVDSFELRLNGALRPGVAYRVFMFIDLNDNGVYDPRGDHGSSVEGIATTRGLFFAHDHHTNRTWLE